MNGSTAGRMGLRANSGFDFSGNDGTSVHLGIDNSGNATFAGDIIIESAFPNIKLIDTNNNDDYEVRNDNGTFSIRNSTDSSNVFQIDGSNNATFAGNVGLGGTTHGTSTSLTNIWLGATGHLYSETTAGTGKTVSISQNAHVDSDGSWEYIHGDKASNIYLYNGTCGFRTAAAGTAGNDITWSETLTLGNDGNATFAGNATIGSLNGTLKVGGTDGTLGITLDYNQSGNTVSKLIANPVYTNTAALFHIACDGNDNPNQLVLKGDGNIGIGTSTPYRLLTVNDDSSDAYSSTAANNGVLRLHNTNGADNSGVNNHVGIEMYVASGATTVGMLSMVRTGNNTGDFTYKSRTGASSYAEHFRIKSDGTANFTGDVLIGRTSVGNTGNGHSLRAADSCIFSRDANGETVQISRNSSDGEWIQFRSGDSGNASSIGGIAKSGSSVAYNTSSDYRLKENEVAISDGITRLKTLKPYRFNFKTEPSKTVDGFFAHEVTAVPEAISGEKDGTEMQGIDQSKLVPLLTAALQEAIAKIETLETKVAALESS